jgi:diguanylate cyclase (GGDEF)-like protein
VLTLALFDVDHLKDINDTVGHDAGDRLLCTVADRLGVALGEGAMVARLGGDEFAAIVEADTIAGAHERFGAALTSLRQPLATELMTFDCQATAGAAVFPRDGRTAYDLLKSADMALYAGKAGARGAISHFQPDMRAGLQRRASMLSVARMIARDDRIMPYYQPKVTLADGSLSGFEALLRWHHDTLGVQGPDTIAAAFDDLAAASALGERMLERVCLDLARWRDEGATLVPVAVNLSPAEFRRGDLFERIMSQLRRYDLPATLIELEVTETVFLGRGSELVGDTLAAFHRAGVSIALDDFGTGYASLKHLRDFPVDVIKIDRSFVTELADNPDDAAIVDAVLGLARRLGIGVVAEGVETAEQAAYLLARDCPLAQGYLFGRPMPARQAAKLLQIPRSVRRA